jgi:hypothetical protein
MAFGFFILCQGTDSLKAEHLGVRLLTVQWLANVTTLSYHMAGITCNVLGWALMAAGALTCRRGDKRLVAANPDIAPPKSLVFVVLVAILFGFAGSKIVSKWFTTHNL